MIADVKGKDYHIDGNGQYTVYKKPAADRFPKEFANPLKADTT